MVGAWLVQELVEVVVSRRTLVLALGRRDLAGDGRSAVLLILPVLAARGRPIAVAPLLFRRSLVALEDGPDRLLTRGVVGGDVQELLGGSWALATQLVNQGLVCSPRQERPDDVGTGDVGDGVALFGEASDVLPEGLSQLLLAILEIPWVPCWEGDARARCEPSRPNTAGGYK